MPATGIVDRGVAEGEGGGQVAARSKDAVEARFAEAPQAAGQRAVQLASVAVARDADVELLLDAALDQKQPAVVHSEQRVQAGVDGIARERDGLVGGVDEVVLPAGRGAHAEADPVADPEGRPHAADRERHPLARAQGHRAAVGQLRGDQILAAEERPEIERQTVPGMAEPAGLRFVAPIQLVPPRNEPRGFVVHGGDRPGLGRGGRLGSGAWFGALDGRAGRLGRIDCRCGVVCRRGAPDDPRRHGAARGQGGPLAGRGRRLEARRAGSGRGQRARTNALPSCPIEHLRKLVVAVPCLHAIAVVRRAHRSRT